MEQLRVSEEEVEALATALAKVIAANKVKLPKVEARIAKSGPWTNFALVLAAVYGPRAWMLWKMWEAERASRKKGAIAVMPARDRSDVETAAAAADSSDKVN